MQIRWNGAFDMDNESQSNARPRFLIEVIVFVCGALVMVYEIVGSRIVAPHIGTSTYVWTSLIGVILGALSLGYWIGGRTADERPSERILASALFAAGGLVSVTILAKDAVLSMIAALPTGLEVRSLVASLLLFAPASVALGFVIPYATKLRLSSLEHSGRIVGRLYALSTLGSIAGTFAAGFLLIPFVGSVRTLYMIAGSLFALSILIGGFSLRRSQIATIALLALGIAATEIEAYYLFSKYNLIDIDTEYSRVRIFDTTDPRTGRPMRAMSIDPDYVQSARFLDGDDLALEYTKFYHLARHFKPDLREALMIGGAGFSFPQDYLRQYPDVRIDVVEIDPQMSELAAKHFDLVPNERLRIFHEDGRVFLNNAPKAKYDAVLLDAFGSLFSIPFQLTTIEAVREIRKTLNDDGVAIVNIGTAVTGQGSRFLEAECATYRAVFANVSIVKVRPVTPNDAVQNVMLIASAKPLSGYIEPMPDMLRHGLIDLIPPNDTAILTDDIAPVERFASIANTIRRR